MATAKEQALIQEIQKNYGTHIDLHASPAVLMEIIRKYKHQLGDDDGDGGGGGGGGVSPGVDDSTIAVGIDDGVGGGGGVSGGGVNTIDAGRFQRVDNEALLKEILSLKKQMKDLHNKIDQKGATGFKAQ